MNIKISVGNTKMGKIPSISLSPIKACGNCSKCMGLCYAKQAYLQYPQTRTAYDINLKEARTNLHGYFLQIGAYLEKKKPKYFRWHVAGDILSLDYLHNMITLAYSFPEIKFLCFTKMFHIVNTYIYEGGKIPDNLKIFFSAWGNERLFNKYQLSVARAVKKEDLNRHQGFKCEGNCEQCGFCFEAETGSTVIFKMH